MSQKCCPRGNRHLHGIMPQFERMYRQHPKGRRRCHVDTRHNDSLSPAPGVRLDSGNQIRHRPSAWHYLMGAAQQIVQFVLRIDTQQLIECGNNVSWH